MRKQLQACVIVFFSFVVYVVSGENVVVVGVDGKSTLAVMSSNPVCLFQSQTDMPLTGGFFNHARAWADGQNLRITSFEDQAFVFLGNQRVAIVKLATAKPGDVLLQYSERGFTLLLKVLKRQGPVPVSTSQPPSLYLDVQITRP